MTTIHAYKVDGIDGEEINLADFKGKKMLLVNVASECGFTPQYKQLQELYETFGDKLIIIGFPANNFGNQEPGTNQEIQSFCSTIYKVTFPLTAKISVTGTAIHPIYEWLTKSRLNQKQDSEVVWNFQKYLIDENGQFVACYPSSTDPLSSEILDWITS